MPKPTCTARGWGYGYGYGYGYGHLSGSTPMISFPLLLHKQPSAAGKHDRRQDIKY